MNGKFLGNVGLSAVVLCLVAFAVVKISASSSGVAGVLLPEVTVSDSAKELLHSVSLVRSAVTVQKAGNIVDASFAIENKGGQDIKNVSVLCTLFDAAGKEQGRDKWVVFDTVKSQGHGVFTFSDKMFISDSIVRSDCKIVDLQLVKAPLITVHRATGGHGAAAHDEHGGVKHDSGHGSQH
ncbi:MAG: hypothetical protein U9R57_01265 [Thermodesulfobacteriota bacterium]|nr:hypothetical protein [Thermodesulfobacteriota bacterium]